MVTAMSLLSGIPRERLLRHDIKDIDFSSNPNGIRDTRRKIFYNIVQRQGKDISGSKIAKELALE
jgi:hypothetical protein